MLSAIETTVGRDCRRLRRVQVLTLHAVNLPCLPRLVANTLRQCRNHAQMRFPAVFLFIAGDELHSADLNAIMLQKAAIVYFLTVVAAVLAGDVVAV